MALCFFNKIYWLGMYLSCVRKRFLNTLPLDVFAFLLFNLARFFYELFVRSSECINHFAGRLLLSLSVFNTFFDCSVCVGFQGESESEGALDSELNLPAINFNGYGLLSANIVQIITIILLSFCKRKHKHSRASQGLAESDEEERSILQRQPIVMLINLIKHAAPTKQQLNEPTRV